MARPGPVRAGNGFDVLLTDPIDTFDLQAKRANGDDSIHTKHEEGFDTLGEDDEDVYDEDNDDDDDDDDGDALSSSSSIPDDVSSLVPASI